MLFDTTESPEKGAARENSFARRWISLARTAQIEPGEGLVCALSGGADSTLLLHLVASIRPRPRLIAVHVDHGLRGEESRADAEFCVHLCKRLGVPLVRRTIELDADGPSLEARARRARYRVLSEEARKHGLRTVLTGHHADDALETVLLRWVRGTDLPGLTGPRLRNELGTDLDSAAEASDTKITVVRPLLGLRREEVRRLLKAQGLEWREDSSNASSAFKRNRVRNDLLPRIEEACGPRAIEDLRAFGSAVETLEDRLATLTAHIAWSPPVHAQAARGPRRAALGGTIERGTLMNLPRPLRRRALWRLLTEGPRRAPTRAQLETLLDDLDSARNTRRSLNAGWSVLLGAKLLHLLPPGEAPPALGSPSGETPWKQLNLPAIAQVAPNTEPDGLRLPIGGAVELPDGRVLRAEFVEATPGSPYPHGPNTVELDAEGLGAPLSVRWPRSGDRFQALGAPGSKRLFRFLADCGVPAHDRRWVPLVFAGKELLWAAGIRLGESRRIRARTTRRLKLELS